MSLFRWIACSAVILTMAAACGGPTTDPAVARDFKDYRTQMAQIAGMETEAIAAHVKATEDPSIGDVAYGKFLRETFLPKLAAYYGELTRIHPLTDEIISLHKLFLTRMAYRIAGFSDLEKSARTGSAALIESAKSRNAQSDLYARMWAQKMEELKKRYE